MSKEMEVAKARQSLREATLAMNSARERAEKAERRYEEWMDAHQPVDFLNPAYVELKSESIRYAVMLKEAQDVLLGAQRNFDNALAAQGRRGKTLD
jgi:hypothetical protein